MSVHDVLIGNQSLRARLYKAADEQRMHHCFLFEGPAGIGKAAIALHLAMYVNCLAEEEGQRGLAFHRPSRPCGHCRSCQPILAGSHPDILQVGPDPSKVTRIITTEQARNLINALSLQRHSAKRRFVIIDPVDALNEEAANALLKTLEEPPAGTQFILITSRAASLLQTVRSRSQRVRFGPVGEAEMIPWLESRNLDPRLAALSMGSPGRALALAEGGTQLAEELLAALCAAIGQPVYQLFAFTEGLGKKAEGGAERTELVLDLIEELLR
ncbi:MAG TPA: DNA polymerase III subunit delta', partial [Myxococcota bacterium]|nr:DNA polymerase III subunit delta' [Myxococcota bacterium]